MDIDRLQSRLRRIGVDVPKNTLKRWAYDGLIARPHRYKKGRGGGKGRAVSWDRAAIADAAALWAVREASSRKLLPSKKRIDVIKHAVSHVYEYPFAIYALRPGDPIDAVALKFVDEGFPGLTLFPGRTLPDRSDALNSLVVVWICAKEKARRIKPIPQPVRVTLHWKPIKEISDTERTIVESYKLEKTTIDVADRDEVIHCIGGVDLRKWGLSLFSTSS
jgi:hypothetical protein